MKCGHCEKNHDTVAEVRACYNIAQPDAAVPGATQKQLDFIAILEQERDLSPHKGNLTKQGASDLITDLLALPKPVAPAPVKAAAEKILVPQGYYATPSATGNNDYDFWRVDRPTEGKWTGYVFVKRVIGGHPDQTVLKHQRTKAIQAIKDFGVEKAAQTYGQEIGRCCKCNRSLTDETSRALGIGPDCRSRAA